MLLQNRDRFGLGSSLNVRLEPTKIDLIYISHTGRDFYNMFTFNNFLFVNVVFFEYKNKKELGIFPSGWMFSDFIINSETGFGFSHYHLPSAQLMWLNNQRFS